MSDDVLITPASRKIEFKDNSGNVDGKIELDSNGNLNITSPGGDIALGDTTADVFIGDGTNNVDIVFEQNGEIRGLTGRTLTLGQADSDVAIASQNFTTTTDLHLNNADIVFEGSSADANETTLTVTNPTADRTITLPNATGTVALNEALQGDATNGAGFKTRELVSRGVIGAGTGANVNRSAYTGQTITAGNPNGYYYGNGTLSANYLYALPVTVPGVDETTTTNIPKFRFRIASGSPSANTTIGMGLYTLNKYGYPSQRVSHGSASITTSTAASTIIEITPDVTAITPGRYALAMCNLGATTNNISFNYTGGEGGSFFADGFGSESRISGGSALLHTNVTDTSMPTNLASSSPWYSSYAQLNAPHMDLLLGTSYIGE